MFLKVWQYIRDDKQIKNLNAFIYMVARNSVIDFYRQKSRKEENEEAIHDGHISTIANETDLLLQKVKDAEVAEALAGLTKLKDEYREAIILRYLDELSIKEIAEVLQKNPGNVRILLHRALNALKEAVKKDTNSSK